jgi:hypothetical protein
MGYSVTWLLAFAEVPVAKRSATSRQQKGKIFGNSSKRTKQRIMTDSSLKTISASRWLNQPTVQTRFVDNA